MSTTRTVCGVVTVFLLSLGIGEAQTQFGTAVGTVSDPSGGVVPGVTIRATNEASQLGFPTVSNSAGDYLISGLVPGVYTITAEKAGFKHFEIRGVQMTAERTVRTDIQLSVGESQQTVTVSATAAQLTTESGAVAAATPLQFNLKPGTYLTYNQIIEAALVPVLAGQSYTNGRNIRSYGSESYDRRISLDGSVFSDVQTYRVYMPRGAVEDMQQAGLNADAEHQSPSTSQMFTSKGTNDFHGAVWTEFQNPDLFALAWNARDHRQPGTPSYSWGLRFGAPLYIPKLYNGRNKTFVFLDFEKEHLSQPVTGPETMPTAAMEQGDFSKVSKQVIDPVTGVQFPGNVIPSNRINSIAQTIVNTYFTPKWTAAEPFAANDLTYACPYLNPDWTGFMRVDEQIGSRDEVNVSYDHSWINQFASNTCNNAAGAFVGFDNLRFVFNYFNASWNHIFGPSVYNEFNFGVKMGPWTGYTADHQGQAVLTQLGLPATPGVDASVTGGPTFNINGINTGLAWRAQMIQDFRIYTYRDNLTWIHGRVTTKAGFEFVKQSQYTNSFSGVFGNYTFGGLFSGFGWSDFLLGLPSATARSAPPGPIGQNQAQTGMYVTENLHLTRKLTLDLGVRVQYNTAPVNPFGNEYYNFNIKNGDLVVPNQQVLGEINPALSPALKAVFETASAAGFPSRLVNNQFYVNPRLGFAYHLFDNTVLRGAFGTYGNLLANGAPTGGPFTPGNLSFTNANQCSGGTCAPLFTLANPYPGSSASTTSTLPVTGVNPNLRLPTTSQWNFTVEQRLPMQLVLRASYVGSNMRQLPYQRNLDLPMPSTTPYTPSRRTYPLYPTAFYADSGGVMDYNGLDTEVKRAFHNGLTLNAGYTWAKCMSDADENGNEIKGGSPVAGWGPLGPQIEDPYNRSRDRGNCEDIVRNNFRTMFTLDLPFGRDRAFLNRPGIGGSVLDKIVGGWTWSGMFYAQTGKYFTPFWSGFDYSGTGQSTIRPNRICNGNISNANENLDFNPACFTAPAAGSFGNAGMGIIEGLGTWGLDAGVYKIFRLGPGERVPRLRVSFQSLNFLNHPQPYTTSQGSYTANNPAGVVGVATSSFYLSGVEGNLGSQRQIYLQAQIEW